MTDALLRVEGLTVEFQQGRDNWVPVVEDLSFDISSSEVVGLVGESGSGKTVTSLAVLGLLGYKGGRVTTGSIQFDGSELVGLPRSRWRAFRGGRIGMIFQQPTLALNPALRVGDQIAETIRSHRDVTRRQAWARTVELLRRVEIADPERRARDYPHQFSGGMCQRVMIAQALSCEPDLLIADEPTTALDTTIQASVLELLREIRVETGIAILLITHDLGVIAEMADRVVVMYAGQVVEAGQAFDVLTQPRHPYTEALLSAIPTSTSRRLVTVPGMMTIPGHHPSGCRFSTRCPQARPQCRSDVLPLASVGQEWSSRCVRVGDLYGVAV